MEDFDALLAEAHQRGIRIVMDLVVNHTSDEHPGSSRAASRWITPTETTISGSRAKTATSPTTGAPASAARPGNTTPDRYVLPAPVLPKQPDLNWENPKVRDEVFNMMTWWFDKGIDGFRMDVISMISKDQRFPDGEKHGLYGNGGPYYVNGPRIHEFLQEMNRRVLSKYDIMTVGETPAPRWKTPPVCGAGRQGAEHGLPI